MKNKPLLFWGLGAGVIALVVFIVGYAFVWPVNDDGHKSGRMKDGKCGRISGGMEGMMGEDGGCGMMGMMGDMMSGGMGGMTGGMGGMMSAPVSEAALPITIDQAVDAARRYVDGQGNPDLKVGEIREFTNDFYARVDEKSTGAGAYELSIDRNTGNATPEMGPNLIWNTRYNRGGNSGYMSGMMDCMEGESGDMMDDGGSGTDQSMMDGNESGGMDHSMMGNDGSGGTGGMMSGRASDKPATTDMTIKKAQALDRAQKYLDKQIPGSKSGKLDTFYGYYTVEIAKDGRTLGMLSVNGENGQVWYHGWHGAYLGGKVL